MNLPKKKYLGAGDYLEDDWLVDPKKESVLDSSAQKELADEWEKGILVLDALLEKNHYGVISKDEIENALIELFEEWHKAIKFLRDE